MIIGITGFAQVGKDEVAKVLMSQGFQRVALADRLKSAANHLGWDGSKENRDSGRLFLQRFGDAMKQEFGNNFWVNLLFSTLPATIDLAIPDVRFLSENEVIRSKGGIIWKVERPGYGPYNLHHSETELLRIPVDKIIINDGSLLDLKDKVLATLKLL